MSIWDLVRIDGFESSTNSNSLVRILVCFVLFFFYEFTLFSELVTTKKYFFYQSSHFLSMLRDTKDASIFS